jgi:sugar/nucleoside kinase (ribokinase family)
MKQKVVCVGAVVADLVALPVTSLPAPGGSARTPEITLHIGGCAANSATGLVRLGREVHLCGAVGADPFGRFLAEALEEEGVLLDHFQVRQGHRTGSTFVINTEGEDRRFISDTGANDGDWPDQVSPGFLDDAAVISVHAHGLADRPRVDELVNWFRSARAGGTRVILDIIRIPGRPLMEELERLLPHVDLFTPNEQEALALTGESEALRAAERFRQMGAQGVVVTRGADGLVWLDGEGTGSLSAPPVQERDATGCGDGFIAGCIDAGLDGLPLRDQLIRGSLVGALVSQQPGAIAGLPDRETLQEMFQKHQALYSEDS